MVERLTHLDDGRPVDLEFIRFRGDRMTMRGTARRTPDRGDPDDPADRRPPAARPAAATARPHPSGHRWSTSAFDVPVSVDQALCIEGCNLCVEVCPLDALAIDPDTGKAYMHVDECWYCGPCADRCPTGAVTVNIPYLLR